MRVDCYNASECPLSSLDSGDTFYLDGTLFIKLVVADVDTIVEYPGRCYIASLDRGEIRSIKDDTSVILADTKVVVNTKDSF